MNGRGPHLVTHALLVGVVMVGLSAVWATDVVVLVVHAVLCLVLRLRVDVAVVASAWRWQGLLAR